jgi:hypothetical protein
MASKSTFTQALGGLSLVITGTTIAPPHSFYKSKSTELSSMLHMQITFARSEIIWIS